MSTSDRIAIESPKSASVAPFGWLLGTNDPTDTPIAFRSPASDFWHEHSFDPGAGGDTEVLWVTYRDASPVIGRLEAHYLTQQAVVPLTGDIIQILCLAGHDGKPDLSNLRAFRLSPGIGICMRPGVWHATRADNATCLMLTRGSTTGDLIDHLVHEQAAKETEIAEIKPVQLERDA